MVAVTYGRVAAPKNAGARESSPRSNIATRFVTALMEARLRRAHEEIARHAHLLENNDEYKEILKAKSAIGS